MNDQTSLTQDERRKIPCGIIVGRFQVDELHKAHIKLIQTVVDNHPKVIIFLGLAATRCTLNNPLDFEARKQMILKKFPGVNVLYIKDMPCDKKWSNQLDISINDLRGPNQKVLLYGGRDAFINRYHGRFETYELQQNVFVSGSEIRKTISNKVKGSRDFRAGVVYGVSNQYPKVYPTVDIAIFNDDYTQILLARKPNEDLYRVVGGFVDPGETFETAARREAKEETQLEVSDPKYVTSVVIPDWRYENEVDKITSAVFVAKKIFGNPTPTDDICELKYFDVDEIERDRTNFYELNIVKEHRYLLEQVMNYIKISAVAALARQTKNK